MVTFPEALIKKVLGRQVHNFLICVQPSTNSLKDGKFSSSSPPPLLQLPLRSSPFEGAEAVIEGLKKAKTANITSGVYPLTGTLRSSRRFSV